MSQSSKDEKLRNLTYYCQRFSELNTSKNLGTNAKYKPILLLSVIDLVSQGVLCDNQIFVSDDLIDTFNKYWKVLSSGAYKGGLHYPFLHLQREGFWTIKFKPEFDGLQPKSTKRLREAVEYASLDRELFDLLQDQVARKELIDTLVAAWFSANKTEIEQILQINQNFQDFSPPEQDTSLEGSEKGDIKPKLYLKKSAVRDAFFRKAVVHIYGYKCAFCGLKVTVSLNQNIVDGAHIKPFAQFYDSRIDNGISFCKNHHWAFDKGLFAIDNNYKIVVSSYFQEESPNAKPIREFNGSLILLPDSEDNFPRLEALKWHRKNVFIS
jgi:putative restriction endonuclease